MIELLTGLPENVIGFSAGHEITAADYESVLVPALETKLQKYRRVRLLYVTETYGENKDVPLIMMARGCRQGLCLRINPGYRFLENACTA